MTAVLVTRAEPGAAETARRLIDRGYAPVIAPVLSIVTNASAQLDLSNVQAVLFTSANGARAFAELAPRADVKALCVGDATALAARQAGFADVRSAEGDAEGLAMLARGVLDPRAGALLWASGADVARDISIGLRQSGFEVRREIVYRAWPAARLPEAADAGLRAPGGEWAVGAVLFHSARAAKTFVTLAGEAGLTDRLKRLDAICLSARVAEAAGALAWRQVAVARNPDEDSLLAALDAAARRPGA